MGYGQGRSWWYGDVRLNALFSKQSHNFYSNKSVVTKELIWPAHNTVLFKNVLLVEKSKSYSFDGGVTR